MATSPASPRSGTQLLERAALLLRELAARGAAGWSLRDLAQHCGLDRATVHRILKCLVQQRLVEQRAYDRRYLIGPMNHELGLSVPHRDELTEAARATARRLARSADRVVALAFLRSGDDCVCMARSGATSYTSEAAAIRVGHRGPLLTLASGVAIVAALSAEEARAVCARNRARLAHFGAAHLGRVETLVRASQRQGHVLSTGVVWQGIHSAAVAFGRPGAPVGSLVLSASSGDYPAEAMRRLLPALREAADALAAQFPSPQAASPGRVTYVPGSAR